MNKYRIKDFIKIGGGSACPGDRIEPAVELVKKGKLDYICFDSLSEVELNAFKLHKMEYPDEGFDVFMEERLRAILPLCVSNKTKIIGNMGAANPLAAQKLAINISRQLGIKGIKIAAILGDDVYEIIKKLNTTVLETNDTVDKFGDKLISAYAYIPCIPIVEALQKGADIVITGRVGDASLFLAPMMYEFSWQEDEWDLLAKGILIGHLLECAGQVSGGYFADPPYKTVPNLYRLGFPIAEVFPDGEAIITKVSESGGEVSVATCTEQLLYEVTDPTCYIEADVITDFSEVDFVQVGKDKVKIGGKIKGKPKPKQLKVNLGVKEGYIGEGIVWYVGPGAYERAKLAGEIIKKRLSHIVNLKAENLRFELLGINALCGSFEDTPKMVPNEVGLRVAARTSTKSEALKITREIETIDNNGPAGIGRMPRKEEIKKILGHYVTFIPRDKITTKVIIMEV